MYLLLSFGILTEIAYTVLTFHMYATSPIMNYEASHNVSFIMFAAPQVDVPLSVSHSCV
jgi:hypothetical protein